MSDLELAAAPKLTPVYIPNRFRERVLLHVFGNVVPGISTPLLLAIQGPAGSGKSFQVRKVCEQEGIETKIISGATLAGELEGGAVDAFQSAYEEATSAGSEDKASVLVIDDFHMSIAATISDRHYTVNSQLLTGFLMNLCETKEGHRTPVILTGNDFATLYGPLTRDGRMDFFDWDPGFDDRLRVVTAILSDLVDEQALTDLETLVQTYADKPISFFAAVGTNIAQASLLEALQGGLRSPAIISEYLTNQEHSVSSSRMFEIAEAQASAMAKTYHPSDQEHK